MQMTENLSRTAEKIADLGVSQQGYEYWLDRTTEHKEYPYALYLTYRRIIKDDDVVPVFKYGQFTREDKKRPGDGAKHDKNMRILLYLGLAFPHYCAQAHIKATVKHCEDYLKSMLPERRVINPHIAPTEEIVYATNQHAHQILVEFVDIFRDMEATLVNMSQDPQEYQFKCIISKTWLHIFQPADGGEAEKLFRRTRSVHPNESSVFPTLMRAQDFKVSEMKYPEFVLGTGEVKIIHEAEARSIHTGGSADTDAAQKRRKLGQCLQPVWFVPPPSQLSQPEIYGPFRKALEEMRHVSAYMYAIELKPYTATVDARSALKRVKPEYQFARTKFYVVQDPRRQECANIKVVFPQAAPAGDIEEEHEAEKYGKRRSFFRGGKELWYNVKNHDRSEAADIQWQHALALAQRHLITENEEKERKRSSPATTRSKSPLGAAEDIPAAVTSGPSSSVNPTSRPEPTMQPRERLQFHLEQMTGGGGSREKRKQRTSLSSPATARSSSPLLRRRANVSTPLHFAPTRPESPTYFSPTQLQRPQNFNNPDAYTAPTQLDISSSSATELDISSIPATELDISSIPATELDTSSISATDLEYSPYRAVTQLDESSPETVHSSPSRRQHLTYSVFSPLGSV